MTLSSFSVPPRASATSAASRPSGSVRASVPGGAARSAWAGFPLLSELAGRLERRAERLLLEAFPGSTLEFELKGPDTTPRWMLLRFYWPVDRRWDQRWIWCSPAEAAPLMRRYE